MGSSETTQKFGVAQDFNYIPRTQWVVEQNEGVDGVETVNITNREFPEFNYKNVSCTRLEIMYSLISEHLQTIPCHLS